VVARSMIALVNEDRYRTQPEDAWKRIKMRRPTRRALAVLREAAAWREQAAMDRDLPRGWVLKDESMIDLAIRCPASRAELAEIRAMPPKLARSTDGGILLACVERALALPPEQWPQPPPARRGRGSAPRVGGSEGAAESQGAAGGADESESADESEGAAS